MKRDFRNADIMDADSDRETEKPETAHSPAFHDLTGPIQ